MTAGPFLLDELLQKIWPRWKVFFGRMLSQTARRKIEICLIFIGILYAGFAAFQDEHVLRSKLEQDSTDFANKLASATPTGQQQRISELEQELGNANEEITKLKKKTVSPTLNVINQTETENPDGTFMVSIRAKVVAPITPAKLTIRAKGYDLISVNIGASGMHNTKTWKDTYGKIIMMEDCSDSPKDDFTIQIKAAKRTKIEWQYEF